VRAQDGGKCIPPNRLRIVYWRSKEFWVGRLVGHHDVMTQGRTIKELREDITDAYRLICLD